jgi:hypothetical protein
MVRHRQPIGILWGVLLSLWGTSGLAANISVAPLDDNPAHGIVILAGDLLPGDDIVSDACRTANEGGCRFQQ